MELGGRTVGPSRHCQGGCGAWAPRDQLRAGHSLEGGPLRGGAAGIFRIEMVIVLYKQVIPKTQF